MRVLVFGETGQVARELARHHPASIDPTFLSRSDVDLSYPERCAEAVNAHKPDAVINAAAWTAVDEAETREEMATLINGAAPLHMAQACMERDIPFLHLSSDYVFDGLGSEPFSPDDRVAPLNAYGRSKVAGEMAVRGLGGRHLILRSSWVFSVHGSNFVKTMLRLGRERKEINVVGDQVGGPTPARAMAMALWQVAVAMSDGQQGGTYHLSGAPDTNWADFARTVMRMSASQCIVHGITTEQYPTAAQRPINSRLNCTSFERDFGVLRPDWESSLYEIMKEFGT